MIIIAGPCVVESKEMLIQCAEAIIPACREMGVDYYFKASYKKANRTSINSFTGIGDEKALEYLAEIRDLYKVPILTDIHSVADAELASQYADVLQIPAFLCRQTDILVAAAQTGKTINIKKGQFVAPDDMKKAAAKVKSSGSDKIWITERGTSFGYHDLVVDYRSMIMMKEYGFPVIYDATHSMQKPSIGEQSGGNPQYTQSMALAAVAVGVDGIFFETHPDPKNAKSDASTQLPLGKAANFIAEIVGLNNYLKSKKK